MNMIQPIISSIILIPKSNVSYLLSDCEKTTEGFDCMQTCESIWFKFVSTTGYDAEFVPKCDPIFQKKYANIMYDCPFTVLLID